MIGRKNRATVPARRFARTAGRLQVPDTPAWRLAALAGALLLPFGIAALFCLDPVETPFFPRCPLHALTGLQCPGCGTARALHAALHGRFAEALRFNAALPAVAAILARRGMRDDATAEVWATAQRGPLVIDLAEDFCNIWAIYNIRIY